VCSMQQETLGRGINVVVVDSHTKLVTRVENFDTYEFSKNCCSTVSFFVSADIFTFAFCRVFSYFFALFFGQLSQ